jgi:hypothetical protein
MIMFMVVVVIMVMITLVVISVHIMVPGIITLSFDRGGEDVRDLGDESRCVCADDALARNSEEYGFRRDVCLGHFTGDLVSALTGFMKIHIVVA